MSTPESLSTDRACCPTRSFVDDHATHVDTGDQVVESLIDVIQAVAAGDEVVEGQAPGAIEVQPAPGVALRIGTPVRRAGECALPPHESAWRQRDAVEPLLGDPDDDGD